MLDSHIISVLIFLPSLIFWETFFLKKKPLTKFWLTFIIRVLAAFCNLRKTLCEIIFPNLKLYASHRWHHLNHVTSISALKGNVFHQENLSKISRKSVMKHFVLMAAHDGKSTAYSEEQRKILSLRIWV